MAVMIAKELNEAAIRDDRKNKKAGRQDGPLMGVARSPKASARSAAGRVNAPRRYAARS